ncbi:extracellular solute-binding protein [Natronospirillum operosum]|uniref:Extracellular solute-binding protein n=1 Tax=Natronospirillum operosum TaxID=2759953 RepID=A0A4Z0WDP0_9GAMM|nr:extracellular solute-binding protein [Natronospirillum operosum]TGG94233.1 extracellular solute-binding protein [Natronospirillum operosum]
MKHIKGTLAGLTAAITLSAGTAVYADTVLNTYTWRPQDEALWTYINDNNLIDGVTVRLDTTTEDFESKLRVDMQSNRPDLFFAKAGAPWLSSWMDADVIAPISDYDVDLDMFGAAAITGSTGSDGVVYSVPVGMELQAILYNRAALEQHGISEPQTLAELEAAFATLEENGIVPMHVGARAGWWVNQVFNEVLIAGFAGDDWTRDVITGDACFTDDAYVDALRAVERWRDNGWLNPNPLADDYGAMRTDVALGTSAMMIDGIWSAGPASPMFDIEPDLELGIMPIPEGRAYGFPDFGLAANPNSNKQDAIEKVLQFVITEEFAQLYAEHVGLPAANYDLNVDDERIATAARLIAENNVAANPFFSYELNADEPSYAQLVADEVARLVAGRADAESTAQAIQNGLNGWGYVGADHCS